MELGFAELRFSLGGNSGTCRNDFIDEIEEMNAAHHFSRGIGKREYLKPIHRFIEYLFSLNDTLERERRTRKDIQLYRQQQ